MRCYKCKVAEAVVDGTCLTCRHLCSRCRQRIHAKRHRWCYECKRENERRLYHKKHPEARHNRPRNQERVSMKRK